MNITFKEDLTKEDGFPFYESFLKSGEESLIIVKCPLLSEGESKEDSFWKEFVCGDTQESPSYFIYLKVPNSFKEGYPLKGGCSFDFQVILDLLTASLNLSDKEGLDVFRDDSTVGNVQYSKIYINSPKREAPSAIAIFVPSTPLFNFIVALPREIAGNSDWGTLPSKLKDTYIKRRMEKAFNK